MIWSVFVFTLYEPLFNWVFFLVLFPYSISIVFTNFILGLSDSGDLGSHYALFSYNSISAYLLFICLYLYFILTLAFLAFLYLPIHSFYLPFLFSFTFINVFSFFLYDFIYSSLLISILSSFLFIPLP